MSLLYLIGGGIVYLALWLLGLFGAADAHHPRRRVHDHALNDLAGV